MCICATCRSFQCTCTLCRYSAAVGFGVARSTTHTTTTAPHAQDHVGASNQPSVGATSGSVEAATGTADRDRVTSNPHSVPCHSAVSDEKFKVPAIRLVPAGALPRSGARASVSARRGDGDGDGNGDDGEGDAITIEG